MPGYEWGTNMKNVWRRYPSLTRLFDHCTIEPEELLDSTSIPLVLGKLSVACLAHAIIQPLFFIELHCLLSGRQVLGEVLSSCGDEPQKRIRPPRLPHHSVFVVYFHRSSHLLPSKVPPLSMEVHNDHDFNAPNCMEVESRPASTEVAPA